MACEHCRFRDNVHTLDEVRQALQRLSRCVADLCERIEVLEAAAIEGESLVVGDGFDNGHLLLETGDELLLETGAAIVLEIGTIVTELSTLVDNALLLETAP